VRLPLTVALVAALVPALAACGTSSHGACGPITREALDPQFLVHVLGDADVQYTSDPPTSGPHQPTPQVSGVVSEPIAKPVQVGVLERGDVLVQHRTDLPPDQLVDLEAIAGTGVVVAPAPDLGKPVIATAWLYKRSCSAVDVDAVQEFVDQRLGKGPDDQGR
jgi:hypothetical protein